MQPTHVRTFKSPARSTTSLHNLNRMQFITRTDAEKVIDACPSAEWRLLFALARYGGLRVPSEPRMLKWEDINWIEGFITVTSPKTEHSPGGEYRTIPLFPELRSHLEDMLELTGSGVYVFSDAMRLHKNPSTTLKKYIKRAGIKPWEKTFQNLRSTRETELADQFPIHVVCEWIGNSQPVAMKHYLQVTSDHFAQAVKVATPVATSAPIEAPLTPSKQRMEKPQARNRGELVAVDGLRCVQRLPGRDSNPN